MLALPYFLSFVFFIVFTVLNVLIGIVLNATDEARAENAKRELGFMEDMANKLEDILADDKVTYKELVTLKNELLRLRSQTKKSIRIVGDYPLWSVLFSYSSNSAIVIEVGLKFRCASTGIQVDPLLLKN